MAMPASCPTTQFTNDEQSHPLGSASYPPYEYECPIYCVASPAMPPPPPVVASIVSVDVGSVIDVFPAASGFLPDIMSFSAPDTFLPLRAAYRKTPPANATASVFPSIMHPWCLRRWRLSVPLRLSSVARLSCRRYPDRPWKRFPEQPTSR